MKNLICTLLLITGAAIVSYSQEESSVTLNKLRTNVVVPDLPAFKSLGSEPSNLLRPSTPQAFATSLSEFYSGGKIVVPAAFAAEVTPAQLLNARKGPRELREYARHSVLNSFRISAGTARDTLSPVGAGRSLALGMRINLINQGELATDTLYLEEQFRALRSFRRDAEALRKEFAASKGIDTSAGASTAWDEVMDESPEMKAEYSELEADEVAFPGQRKFLDRIEEIREDYRKRHWNDKRLDLAVAVSSASPDSLLANIRFRRADLWITYALPALNRRGQFLVGVNANLARAAFDSFGVAARNEDAHFNLSVPARLLIGTNRLKGFGEVQYSYAGMDGAHKAFFNLGTELNIIDGVWVNFYAGMDYNTHADAGIFKTNLDLKLTLPENFSLF